MKRKLSRLKPRSWGSQPLQERRERSVRPLIKKGKDGPNERSLSFLLAAVDWLLPHELHFPCLFLDRSIVSVCPLQELFLSFRRTNSKLTMSRTVIKEKKSRENVCSWKQSIRASSWHFLITFSLLISSIIKLSAHTINFIRRGLLREESYKRKCQFL